MQRWLYAAVIALTATSGLRGQSTPQPLSKQPTNAEQLLAEAVIAPSPSGDKVFLPVNIHGHAATVILDLGTNDYLFLSQGLVDSLNMQSTSSGASAPSILDSLSIGTVKESKIPFQIFGIDWPASPPGLPPTVGLVGTRVLVNYDMLLDGPAKRIRLYATNTHRGDTPGHNDAPWFPPGVTASDCTPITVERKPEDHYVSFALTVNGHSIPSFFDSGNNATAINLPAAKIIGIRKSDPNVHLLPADSAVSYPSVGTQRIYSIKGLTLKMGTHTLSDHQVNIYQHIPSPDPSLPELDVGLDAFRDRLLWISYSTNQVCISGPISAK